MTHNGRRGLIVLLVVALAMPAGFAFADQPDRHRDLGLRDRVERAVLRLQAWIDSFGINVEPNGALTRSDDAEAPTERVAAKKKIGAHVEPNG